MTADVTMAIRVNETHRKHSFADVKHFSVTDCIIRHTLVTQSLSSVFVAGHKNPDLSVMPKVTTTEEWLSAVKE